MTANQLREFFSEEFGFLKWPSTWEIDAQTYGHVCHAIFDYKLDDLNRVGLSITIQLGINGGIMFKGVELILKKE